MARRAAAVVLLLAASTAFAAEQAAVPGNAPKSVALDPAMAHRLKHLESELRCLVCQNQTLADSEAGLAQDLRNQVEQLALEGKSDEEIKLWLRERYGDFVLYRPPVQPLTWLLWFGPFALLLAIGIYWIYRLVHARRLAAPAPIAADRESFEAVLTAATGHAPR